jgi:hypothetical protein
MDIWDIVWIFGTFYDHFEHFVFIWDIFPVLVSGNPAFRVKKSGALNVETFSMLDLLKKFRPAPRPVFQTKF